MSLRSTAKARQLAALKQNATSTVSPNSDERTGRADQEAADAVGGQVSPPQVVYMALTGISRVSCIIRGQ